MARAWIQPVMVVLNRPRSRPELSGSLRLFHRLNAMLQVRPGNRP
jgi:hypothetical protein